MALTYLVHTIHVHMSEYKSTTHNMFQFHNDGEAHLNGSTNSTSSLNAVVCSSGGN